jgi:aminopeptidase
VEREELVRRLADVAVAFGANVRPGQIVQVNGDYGHEEMARAVAEAAYRHRAKFVDVWYFDPHVKRSRILHGEEETLEFVPSWYVDRVLARRDQRCAVVALAGAASPGLLDDLDPARVGRDPLPRVPEIMNVVNSRRSNWTVVPAPNTGWARQIYPELDASAALDRLWQEIAYVCRLDDGDPVAAWRERISETDAVAERLNGRRFDALQFEGPGTDLTVGLLPTATWQNAGITTLDGVWHFANLPSEEVGVTPDPERTEGSVRSTRPLVFADGTVIEGLEVEFEGGRATTIRAQAGEDAIRRRCAADEGGLRLGEVALVDEKGRIGKTGTTFFDTLLDENAASHLALGAGYELGVGDEDVPRINKSQVHIDFMIGSPEVTVTGITRAGERVPVLVEERWQI